MTNFVSAIVAGHICLDVIPQLSPMSLEMLGTVFTPGRLTEVGPVVFSTGGAVSNTGLTLHKLGIPTQLMGKIGNDTFGEAVTHIVAAHGGKLVGGMVVDPTVDTSYTIVINAPGLDRIFLHCPGANDSFGADDVSPDLLADAGLFHLGYPPIMARMFRDEGAELLAIFRRAKEAGATTSLDVSLPDPGSPAGQAAWRTILARVLPWVDIFMPSIEESLFMLRRESYDRMRADAGDFLSLVTPELLSDVASELLAMGVKIVGLKLGDRGLYMRTASQPAIDVMGRAHPAASEAWANRELWAPCFDVDVVGTTGAGDATIAGFLASLLRGLPLDGAAVSAVAVGACNVEAADALSGIRTWEATRNRIDVGWTRRALHLTSPGWRFDGAHQLWLGPADQTSGR